MAQTADAAKDNASYFADNAERYARWLATLDSYRMQAEAITRELRGSKRLIDIGNGGAFDYDPTVVESIVAVDLVEDGQEMPPNARYVQGSALELPFDDGSFDVALMVMLLHHLVGERPEDLPQNARRALTEAHRVLAPGGRLVLVESCVPEWFARAEPALYRPLARWAATRGHPPTYQLPPRAVADLVGAVFGRCERTERIPMGRWTVQMGRRWPVALTPARAWLFESRRA